MNESVRAVAKKTFLQEGPVKDKIKAFIDHPWQEDGEIEFVELIREYWDKYQSRPDVDWKDYVWGLAKENKDRLMRREVSDQFMSMLQGITGKVESRKTEAFKSGDKVLWQYRPGERIPARVVNVPPGSRGYGSSAGKGIDLKLDPKEADFYGLDVDQSDVDPKTVRKA